MNIYTYLFYTIRIYNNNNNNNIENDNIKPQALLFDIYLNIGKFIDGILVRKLYLRLNTIHRGLIL